MSSQLKHSLYLLLAAVIWGFAFVAQSEGGFIGTFSFNAIRSFLGCFALLPVIKLTSGDFRMSRSTLIGGIVCGLFLSVACNLQQEGIAWTTTGKAGFITATYIIIVPVIGVLKGKRPGIALFVAIILAAFGMYRLCLPAGESLSALNKGDVLCALSAVAFSMQIICIDRFGCPEEAVKLSALQFFVLGCVSAVLMFIFEDPEIGEIRKAAIPLLYCGLCSTGIAFTLQTVGQQGVNPTIASIIMSLESVFALVGQVLIQGQGMSGREFSGCVLMFIAIIITQLPQKENVPDHG